MYSKRVSGKAFMLRSMSMQRCCQITSSVTPTEIQIHKQLHYSSRPLLYKLYERHLTPQFSPFPAKWNPILTRLYCALTHVFPQDRPKVPTARVHAIHKTLLVFICFQIYMHNQEERDFNSRIWHFYF